MIGAEGGIFRLRGERMHQSLRRPPMIRLPHRSIARVLALTLLSTGLLFLVPGLGSAPALGDAGTTGNVTTYTVAGSTDPLGITAGPSGSIWFTDSGGQIGSLDIATGAGAMHTPTTTNSTPSGIVTGADGNLWFTESASGTNQIGVMNPAGAPAKELTMSTNSILPTAITQASDGRLWFTESGVPSAARMGLVTSTASTAAVAFPVTGTRPAAESSPTAPGLGDGSVWFRAQAT